MKYKIRIAALTASVLIVLAGGSALRAASERAESKGTPPLPLVQASVTVPAPQDPVVVRAGRSSNTRGWAQASGAVVHATSDGVRPELMDAYTQAVALAPAGCHLTVSLLAAIGQVESRNLANHRINAAHRVVPAVLGPVLDGHGFASIPDTDEGTWDGDSHWDRALGPMQFVPASWRVVGLDLDGDGTRDPQNVYDAAGAAMVYLCAGARDLSTEDGLNEAVLAYNHSVRYLHLVLAWKSAFDAADITGLASEASLGMWAMPTLPSATERSTASAKARSASGSAHRRSGSARARNGSSGHAGTPAPSGAGPVAGPASSDPADEPSGTTDPKPSTPPDPAKDPDPATDPDPAACPPAVEPTPGDPATVPQVPGCLPCAAPSPTSGTPGQDPSIVPIPCVPATTGPSEAAAAPTG